jgi:hypothetical protein
MHRACRAAWAAPVLALFALPQLAAAGPIAWSYHAEATYSQDYGSKFALTVAPDGTVACPPGKAASVLLFTSTGEARPEPGSFEALYSFGVAVTITDHASGEAGTLNFSGWYSSHWTYQPENANDADNWRWDYEVSSFGDFWDGRTLELGRNLYTVRAYGGGSGQFPSGEMTVEVAPLAAPEPGTLALAGLGVVLLALTRRRSAVLAVRVVRRR